METKSLKTQGRTELEKRLPLKFPGKKPLPAGFRRGVKGWYIPNAKPGLYTMDVEFLPPNVIKAHNTGGESARKVYSEKLCIHKCKGCFNKQSEVYRRAAPDGTPNKLLTLEETMEVMDQAMEIAESEFHKFMSVKFLGPGELIMNPQLFQIIEEYKKRGIIISIFTKAALLGDNELAVRYQGHAGICCARHLVDKLASYGNVNLLVSFQSFDPALQDEMVRTPAGYTEIRNRALTYLFGSDFYKEDGTTDRICALNAPITPENIHESFEIYKFFIERGTPAIMTPTMVSGEGEDQLKEQQETCIQEEFQELLVELYADIYLYNLLKGIQTLEEIVEEGISSYVGAEPCNQASVGLYLRANGIVQMCPGRFDCSTIFGNVRTQSLSEIWMASPNRQRGLENPRNLVNNGCPAKDATCPEEDSERSFSFGFYKRVRDVFVKKIVMWNLYGFGDIK